MTPEAITVGRVKQTLRGLARGESAPDRLLPMLHLHENEAPAELRSYLTQLILPKLRDLRARAQPAPARETPARLVPVGVASDATEAEVQAGLAHDFALGAAVLEAWSALYHRYLCDAGLPVEALAAAAHVSERHFRRRVETGLQLLVEQLRLAELAAQGRLRRLQLDRYLPPPDYLHLFGVQEQIAALVAQLTASDSTGPAIIALEGIGGIGKTTLAQAVAYRLAESGPFAAILWASAQQSRLLPGTGAIEALPEPAHTFADLLLQLVRQLGQDDLLPLGPDKWERTLQALFHDAPHLIVVDNLETLADCQAIVPRLRQMLGPSRALITSRQSLGEYAFVQAWPVPPLSQADSLALVRSELARVGRRTASPTDQALGEVCALVGGLPLALKLIAGLLNHGVPLDQIRGDLQRAAGEAHSLYTYIYRRTWRLLSEAARQLLVDMLLVSAEGEDLAWLTATSDLTPDALRAALSQLLTHCLLQITGPLDHPFYRLHPLTALFLKTDLMGDWGQAGVGP